MTHRKFLLTLTILTSLLPSVTRGQDSNQSNWLGLYLDSPPWSFVYGQYYRYVILNKDDSVTFAVDPTTELTEIDWTFENGTPDSVVANGIGVYCFSWRQPHRLQCICAQCYLCDKIS
jgi:hypothetical protein